MEDSRQYLHNEQLVAAMDEMKRLRKSIHVQKENEALHKQGKATQCKDCEHIMPHITTRKCTCHAKSCGKYKVTSSCTIFRKVSRCNSTDSIPKMKEIKE